MIEVSPEYRVAIIGNGWVGKAYNQMFPDAVVYDEPQIRDSFETESGVQIAIDAGRLAVNECDLALVCVPTDPIQVQPKHRDGWDNQAPIRNELGMSIIEEVIDWVETPLILCKSALQPGTVDRLVEKTGKNIAVSVEMVGEGKYFVPYWKYPDAEDPTKHSFLIVGGEEETAKKCADFIWRKMSPDIDIHLVSAVEAEITKLMENTWGAQKVTFANVMYDICEKYGANYTKVLQAWGADGRTEKMHMRVMDHKRGWASKCFDKDVPALADIDESGFLRAMVRANQLHRAKNDSERR